MVVQQYSVHGDDARVLCELSELPIGILFRRSNKYPLLPLAFSMSHISPSRTLDCVYLQGECWVSLASRLQRQVRVVSLAFEASRTEQTYNYLQQ
jgi:hypothetical protein